MREPLLLGSKCSSLLSYKTIEKYLQTWRQFAWLIYNQISHQRLNVGHLITNFFFFTGRPFSNSLNQKEVIQMNKNLLSENKEIFDQWLVGFTDGDGTFSINRQNDQKWSLTFKLSQNSYNFRILYFIKTKLGVGNINIEKNNMANFRIRDRSKLESVIFPIFDKYPLLTTKYFNYLKFKKAYSVLTNASLSLTEKNKIMNEIVSSKPPVDYISPAWDLVDNNVTNFETASKVMSKPWLIGFTESQGWFYLIAKSSDRLVHAFEITQKLDKIVLLAIKYILGINPQGTNLINKYKYKKYYNSYGNK